MFGSFWIFLEFFGDHCPERNPRRLYFFASLCFIYFLVGGVRKVHNTKFIKHHQAKMAYSKQMQVVQYRVVVPRSGQFECFWNSLSIFYSNIFTFPSFNLQLFWMWGGWLPALGHVRGPKPLEIFNDPERHVEVWVANRQQLGNAGEFCLNLGQVVSGT